MVASGSPAEKADFHKNDVLVELDGQMLVDMHQLRKLVRMHAEGDKVELTFYRGGKKQTISVKLAKITLEASNDDTEATPMPGDLQDLQLQLKSLNGDLRSMSGSRTRCGTRRPLTARP
jgi:C-terminal processing protease CtpA/Prc